jgi:hypothetical protein
VLEMIEESVTEHVESIQGAVTSVQRQVNNKECAGMPARYSLRYGQPPVRSPSWHVGRDYLSAAPEPAIRPRNTVTEAGGNV